MVACYKQIDETMRIRTANNDHGGGGEGDGDDADDAEAATAAAAETRLDDDDRARQCVQSMALSTSLAVRRVEFLRQFIYESTLLRLLNDEYAQLRGDDQPRETFIDATSVVAARAHTQLTQSVPEAVRTMNMAEVECRLLNQMYRYRAHVYTQHHGRPFALVAKTPSATLTPDETMLM